VSNENIVHLDRRLRSDKPDVHYFITSPLPPRDLGVEFAQPTPLTVTPNSTFGAVGGHEQITDSPQRAEKEEEVEEELEEVEGAEESEEEEDDEVFIPPPQPFIAPPDLNSVAPIPVAVADDESAMAEERTLLPNQFGGGPDEDPAEFWRRLDNYVAYKNLTADASIRLAKAMFVQSTCDWLDGLEDAKKNTLEHLKAAFTERFIQPSILRFKSAREIFGKKTRDE